MLRLFGLSILLFLMTHANSFASEIMGYLPHLTQPSARVQTQIVIENPTPATHHVRFEDTLTGIVLHYKVAAYDRYVFNPKGLGYPQSLRFEKSTPALKLSVVYNSPLMKAPLEVAEPPAPSKIFRFEAMDTDRLWQGFVALNTADEAADVTVLHYSRDGELLGELPIAQNLAPGAKAREVLNNFDWLVEKGSYFEVVATQDVSVIMLYGSYLTDGNAVMRVAQGTIVKEPKMVFQNANGASLTLTPGVMNLDGQRFEFEAFDQVWEQFQMLKLSARQEPTTHQPLYTARLTRGEQQNAWKIDQTALMQDYRAMQAVDLIDHLFQQAKDLASR